MSIAALGMSHANPSHLWSTDTDVLIRSVPLVNPHSAAPRA